MSLDSAGESRAVAPAFEAIARDLAAMGVDTIFGLMGDDTAKLVSSLKDVGVMYYGARHENTAVAMAEGYSSATGRLGVCIVSRGPGLTNALTAAVSSARTHSRVLIILGHGPARGDPNRSGPEYKALNGVGVELASGIRAYTPQSAGAVRMTLRDAVSTALEGNTVAFNIPVDLVDAEVNLSLGSDLAPSVPIDDPRAPRGEALAQVVELLAASRRPLILAGGGAHRSNACSALKSLGDRVGALLGTSLKAKDLFRGHDFNIGIVGSLSHAVARDLASQADLILVFGATMTQFTTGWGESFAGATIVHVDSVRSHIGRYCRADAAVVGDARTVAEQLLELVPERDPLEKPFRSAEIRDRLANYYPTDEFAPEDTSWTVDPRLLALELDALLPDDRAVVCDLGNFFGFVPPYISVPDPSRFHYCFDFAAIGLSFGLALGVAVGGPGWPTVLFVGDGALLMTLGELETVARCDIPLLIVVMNDAAYGAERHYLEVEGMSGASAIYPDVDFAAVAASFGIEGASVRSLEDVRALGSRLSNSQEPYLLDCKVTPTVRDPTFDEQFAATKGDQGRGQGSQPQPAGSSHNTHSFHTDAPIR